MKHTLETLQAWLADDTNFHYKRENIIPHKDFNFMGVRNHLTLTNKETLSIQQSSSHNCDKASVEMWFCPHHYILDPYGNGNDPYDNVPLSVVVEYLNLVEQGL